MSETTLEHHHEKTENARFGFWVYLMTDLIMFSALFAAYAVLRNNTFGGPGGGDIFNLPFVLTETFILLTSSFTCGLATVSINQKKLKQALWWLGATFLLGASFLIMELTEFHRLIADGNGPQRSAFLSSYFTLVGAHGLHIAVGLLWMIIAGIVAYKRGLTEKTASQLTRLALFWHFLDLVWIFIFTIVYLIGVL
ncbi:MAG: cytochrome o ubiquinol oxidase subunit III [Candidatus Doudnabacteria bacterium]|nr:cytochrome o ubiquinol oxidase subunit III [Candidatus Doudnabacteria bacterium]